MEGRQVAWKVRIQDIIEGTYVRVSGEWEPNFIQTPDGRKISRTNIIAVVATEPVPDMNYSSFIIDDGTGRVPVRIFEELKTNVVLGDVVLVIGRPREYNQQTYLVPEIIKKIEDNRWVDYRNLELGTKAPTEKVEYKEEPKSETKVDAIVAAIADLDSGEGADTEEVIAKCGDCEPLINGLLKEGEIFEIKPGRLKVLE